MADTPSDLEVLASAGSQRALRAGLTVERSDG
jgi:hypothetical protein